MTELAHEIRATWRRPPVVHPIGPAAAAVILLIASWGLESNVATAIALGTLVALLLSRLYPSLLPWVHRSEQRGVLAIAPSGDWSWNGALFAKRSNVRQALVSPPIGDSPALLLVEVWGGEVVEFEVRLGEARRFLEAARLDAIHSVATFTIASRADTNWIFTWMLRVAPVAFLIGGAVFSSVEIGLLSVPAIVLLVVSHAIPTRVRVGADAIEWRWLLFRTRIAYRDLRATKYGEGVIAFDKRDGARVVLRSGTSGKHLEVHHRLRERIERAVRAHDRALDAPQFDIVMLDRHGDSVGDWIERLRALGAPSTADYRAAPIDRSAIVATVHDTAASPARRAAALVVVADALDEEERERLAAAAGGVLDTDLRAAIGAALAADDAALRRAMDALTRH